MMGKWFLGRREFLRAAGGAVAGGFAAGSVFMQTGCANYSNVCSENSGQSVRFGMVTDSHYADAKARGTRFYRDSKAKLTACVDLMNTQGVDFMIELGDFKDQNELADEHKTLRYLHDIEGVFQGYKGARYHVLGNHDMDSISKQQFLSGVVNTGIVKSKGYYSFDVKGVHFVVLDACFAGKAARYADYDHGDFNWQDTNVPPAELAWLKDNLAGTATGTNTIVFIHQLLDGTGGVYVNNAREVRKVLELSGKVRAVFQGHHHPGAYSFVNGIHYYTLRAMVEGAGLINNSCAVVDVEANGNIKLTGYLQAVSKDMVFQSGKGG